MKRVYRFLFITLILSAPFSFLSRPVLADTYEFITQFRFPVQIDDIWASADNMHGLPYAKVEVYDEEVIGATALGTYETDFNGFVHFTITPTTDALDPDPDIYFVIKLYNDVTDVEQFAGPVYSWQSQTMENLAPGLHEITVELGGDDDAKNAANVFAVAAVGLDITYNEEKVPYVNRIPFVYPAFPDSSFCNPVFLYVNISTDTYFLADMTLHELGHCLSGLSSTYDLVIPDYNLNGDPYHDLDTEEYPVTAFIEGWAEFYTDYLSQALMGTPNPGYKLFDEITKVSGGENIVFSPYEERNERNVAGALWDLTDAEADTQTIFVSATQLTPITDVKLWSKVSNLKEVNALLAVSSKWVAVYGKDTSGVEGIYIFTRASTPRMARYVNPSKLGLNSISNILSYTDYFFSSNYLYVMNNNNMTPVNNITRINLVSKTFPGLLITQDVLKSSSSKSLFSYSKTDNVYEADSILSSDRAAIYVSIPDDGTTTYTSVTYKISDLDSTLPTMTNIGSAPSPDVSCHWFHNDKCYSINSLGDIYPYNVTFIEFDPKTGVTDDLWPNADSETTFIYGDFVNVAGLPSYFIDFSSIVALNDRAYFFYESLGEGCMIMEIDLSKKIMARQAGDGTCALKNDANLMSQFQEDTRIVMDDSLYYYTYQLADTRALPILTSVRQVELDPVGEKVNSFCGSDTMYLYLSDVYNALDNTYTSIEPFMTHIHSLYGGDYLGIMANNWIQMITCESTSGTHETVPPGSTSRGTGMNETFVSADIDSSRYFDGDTDIVKFPMKIAHSSGADGDGDGVFDVDDEFPSDGDEWVDFDNDGTGDNADTDDDNDGEADSTDAFPYDPHESKDSDGDGVGDNADVT